MVTVAMDHGNMQGTYNMTTDVRKHGHRKIQMQKSIMWADQLGEKNYRNSTLFAYKAIIYRYDKYPILFLAEIAYQ